jgi:putative membrane-bound dehydrogenase-like protein
MHTCLCKLFLAGAFFVVSAFTAAGQEPKPLFRSEVVTKATPNHAVPVSVDIRGLKQIYLVVDDGGNGFSHDWADWADAKLVGPKGQLALSSLKPTVTSSGWGSVQMNKNCEGRPLRISGRAFDSGIGVHANSIVGFELPPGYEKFEAMVGLDEGGTSQPGGDNASVRFLVYSQKPKGGSTGAGGSRDSADAVSGLDVADGLEAKLFAAEPQLLSLTNLDVDHRGRVWACEVVNYRGHNGERPEGDRILICTDTDGDGASDQVKVYYQGRDIDSAMGICVLGNKVIVSCSPNIWVFTDENGDDVPDKKELLFSKTGSAQHDHAAHSFVFGPDGKLYWNFGNEGHAVHDAAGNLLKDKQGNEVSARGKPYWGGMVFRCNPDGTELEVLGHNFRNNYEAAVDSFGALWQSDNDDDGNRGVRINFVMEYGNYGYLEERTGAGWQGKRTGMENDIPRRHWHQDDPGVVPNLLVTGGGSPTGITVYEGELLPEPFRNQMIHCDAGPNVVRSYAVAPQGGGFRVTAVNNVLLGARDNWFRPADVAVAPDGSLFISDWYDPGVGGHGMGDTARGRLFRVAPPGARFEIPKYDLSTPAGAVAALRNPCQSVRYLAWQALHKFGAEATEALTQMASDSNPRFRARALWLLSLIPGRASEALSAAATDADENVRAMTARMARRHPKLLGEWLAMLMEDDSPMVRREAAIALRDYPREDAPVIWAELAARHRRGDRWYLEAIGIAAEGRWNQCLAAWRELVGDQWTSPAGQDIVWRSRGDKTSEMIAQLLQDPSLDGIQILRLFRALDFQPAEQRAVAMKQLALQTEQRADQSQGIAPLFLLELAARTPEFVSLEVPQLRKSLGEYLKTTAPDDEFVEWAAKLQLGGLGERLLETILNSGNDRNRLATATRRLIESGGVELLMAKFITVEEPQQVNMVRGLQYSGAQESREMLQQLLERGEPSALVKSEIVKSLAVWPYGQKYMLERIAKGDWPEELRFPAANVLLTSNEEAIRTEAAKYLSLPASADNRPLPPLGELLKKQGDSARGKEVFINAGTCAKCHKVRGEGQEVGPDLSEVGNKLSVEALYESILNPSAGISHSYEMYSLLTGDGRTISGLLVSQTDEEIVLKDKDAVVHKVPRSEVDEFAKQQKSLMPEDLQKQLTEQQLVDVIEYLKTLRK